jgi:AcrR family transcriptional regulator
MSSTRDKILESAVTLFNERGFVNVTLRDIASDLGISPGNLAYHFKNKDAILSEVYARMNTELSERIAHIRHIPSFENIDYEIRPFLEFQRKYRFFYLDILEICRGYPTIAAEHRAQTRSQIAAIRSVIHYSVDRGNMVPEQVAGHYDRMAHTVWMIWAFWLTRSSILGQEERGDDQARQAIWSLVLPYLSPKGLTQFEPVALRHRLTEKQPL